MTTVYGNQTPALKNLHICLNISVGCQINQRWMKKIVRLPKTKHNNVVNPGNGSTQCSADGADFRLAVPRTTDCTTGHRNLCSRHDVIE